MRATLPQQLFIEGAQEFVHKEEAPPCHIVQGRPMKAAWFDALVFDPRFGGQNCLSVVQALQAKLGNLMAVRQNLCVQISVCWLQCLIELAGKELVIFKFDF